MRRGMISSLDRYIYSLVKVHHWWSLNHDCVFFFLCTVCLHIWKLCGCKKITVLQQQINLLICLFFVQLSALVELDIQEEYLTRNLVWLAGDNFVVLNLLPWTKKVQNNHSDICIEWSCDHFGGMSPENCYFGTKMNS